LNVLGGVAAEPLIRARWSPRAGDAPALARELEHRGIACDVEARDRLVVLRCAGAADADRLVDPAARDAVLDAARGQGFTHVAIDLETEPGDASLRRD
jgi:hypothetical protein